MFVSYTVSENEENILQIELQIVEVEILTAVALNRYNAMQSGGNQCFEGTFSFYPHYRKVRHLFAACFILNFAWLRLLS
jgi:hypothetical protein